MKFAYIANIRLPTEKAHGAQIMKTSEALARAGVDVTLVVPARRTPIPEDPFTYYGLKTRFPIVYLPVPDTVHLGFFGFVFESLWFAAQAARYIRANPPELVYGRDELILWLLPSLFPKIWETHTGAWNFFARSLIRKARRVVAISEGLKTFYVRQGVSPDRIVVAHDGIDVEAFAHPESQESARRRLGLPVDKTIVMYIGRLDGWKGSGALLESAALLPGHIEMAVVGGEPQQVEFLKEKYKKVHFLGFRPYRELADNEAAANMLILPNTDRDEVSRHFTSPLKLFAYMASGLPIIASDLPSLREILPEDAGFFVNPAPEEFARGILYVSEHYPEALERARRAKILAEKYSWEARARVILAASL